MSTIQNHFKRVLALILALAMTPIVTTTTLAVQDNSELVVTDDSNSGFGTLRYILQNIAQDGDTITFDPSVTTIELTSGEIAFGKKNITIDGGTGVTITRTGSAFRLLNSTAEDGTVTLKGLTIKNGNATNSGNNGLGGGVRAVANAVLINCNFTDNKAVSGAGISVGGDVTAFNCTFTGNMANIDSGGLQAGGDATLANCTFINNRASGGKGGGLKIACSSTLTNCNISGNIAGDYGGGIYTGAGTNTLTDCIFRNNSSNTGGGAVYAYDRIIMKNCGLDSNKSPLGIVYSDYGDITA